MTSISYISAQF